MNQPAPAYPSRPEISRTESSKNLSEPDRPEVAPEAPESGPAVPETSEVAVDQTIAAKKEEIQAEPVAETPSAASVSAVAAPAPADRGYVSVSDLKRLKNMPRESQIKFLTEIVYQKGLDRAIAAVRHLDDPYLLDLLHDTLVDELYQKLKRTK